MKMTQLITKQRCKGVTHLSTKQRQEVIKDRGFPRITGTSMERALSLMSNREEDGESQSPWGEEGGDSLEVLSRLAHFVRATLLQHNVPVTPFGPKMNCCFEVSGSSCYQILVLPPKLIFRLKVEPCQACCDPQSLSQTVLTIFVLLALTAPNKNHAGITLHELIVGKKSNSLIWGK